MEEWFSSGWINIVGGCCGTSPDFIQKFSELTADKKPRVPVKENHQTVYTGLDPYRITPERPFTMIGERTNVTGSRKFARLINEKKYEEALQVAAQQVETVQT